jgi:Ca2+-binding RTX toxin-like protein
MAFISGTFRGDTLTGTNRDDFILGLFGDDILRGRDGNDFIDGGNENDQLEGGNGRDILLGGEGTDRLEGGNGPDYLDGGFGADRSFGGNGDDTILVDKADHAGKVDGGNGIDTVQVYIRGDFDLRGYVTNVERVEQGDGNADAVLDQDFFLTADSDEVVIDLGAGGDDTVSVVYDGDVLDFALIAGEIKFGEPGDLDSALVLDDVEHLNLFDSNDPTGNHVFDHWII